MGIVSFHELRRTGEWEALQGVKLTREFVVVLSDNTLENSPTPETTIFQTIGVDIGDRHPTYIDNKVRKATLTEGYEGSPYHAHVLYEYGPMLASDILPPTARPYVWEAESSIGEIAATFFWEGTERRPLTNSAYDFFPGLTTGEGLAILRVTGNFATWPSQWFTATNHVNSDAYAGCPANTLKVVKVRCAHKVEQSGPSAVSFWQAVAEIQYRETTHNQWLPDVGWNYLSGGQKRRAMVFDNENNEWVPSPTPIGLNGNGGQSPTGWPYILERRMNPQLVFGALFGQFPTQPPAL